MIRSLFIAVLFFVVVSPASSQVTLISRTNPFYFLTIDLTTSSLVNKSCSSGSFTYQPLITYDMVFSTSSFTPLTYCFGELRCTGGSSSFALPLSGGAGAVLGDTTSYTGAVSCSQANPARLLCDNYSLSLAGPDFNTTATSIYSQAVALPLHLVSFDARDEQGMVHFFWKVTSEKPGLSFDLQSSSDSRAWRSSGAVVSSSQTSDGISFSAYETRPVSGIMYYRVRQLEANGSESFSRTIAVRAESDLGLVKISPNPVVNDQLHIDGLQNTDDWRIDAVNMSGQPIRLSATAKSTFSLTGLPSGIYALRLTHKHTGEMKVLTFSKK